MFFFVVGMTVKENIRERKLACDYNDLKNNTTSYLEAAMNDSFHSTDGFSRSFQRQFGTLPFKIKRVSILSTNIYVVSYNGQQSRKLAQPMTTLSD